MKRSEIYLRAAEVACEPGYELGCCFALKMAGYHDPYAEEYGYVDGSFHQLMSPNGYPGAWYWFDTDGDQHEAQFERVMLLLLASAISAAEGN